MAVSSPVCEVSGTYPKKVRKWCDLITFYSQQNGLEPDLVARMIEVESGGKPKAISKSGAIGLMQIMPRDGRAASFMCVNGPCFSGRPTTERLLDPEFNISYGTRMLKNLIKKHGNLRDALKAYGPSNVGYWYADLILGGYKR